jgi:hypothetical protein
MEARGDMRRLSVRIVFETEVPMWLEHDGRRWDETELRVFETGDPCLPRIFLARDDSAVFVESADGPMGTTLLRARPDEIIRLAARYAIGALSRVILRNVPPWPLDSVETEAEGTHSEAWIG